MGDIFSKADLINALNEYIEVLKHDIEHEQNDLGKTILENVKFSLEDIVDMFKD